MKNAVITGTSTGIGLATSLHLARNGYKVFAGMRNLAKAEALRSAAAAEALPIEVVQLDICDAGSVTDAFSLIHGHGHVDVLVNNAGIGGAS
ncbi:MAG: SDR family NAD(P)-dependent oxidoreductase, partial [Proteobacteria bacterium]|nr:SDR family NAD(P)-dependent oxidoreductase [Pseudomonadota bacterium]